MAFYFQGHAPSARDCASGAVRGGNEEGAEEELLPLPLSTELERRTVCAQRYLKVGAAIGLFVCLGSLLLLVTGAGGKINRMHAEDAEHWLQSFAANISKVNSTRIHATNRSSAEANSTRAMRPNSLFCFSLTIPWSADEKELLKWQFDVGKGIFGCDIATVYSNTSIDYGGNLTNKLVDVALEAPIGGQWNTRMNSQIFAKLWSQVIKDGQYKQAAWTVKADPDAVFLADRLRELVATPSHAGAQEGNGMFAWNCEYIGSMHGAIELFSRRAIVVYGESGKKQCTQHWVHGPGVGNSATFPNLLVEWGQEDVWMRSCMELLGVKIIKEWQLLAEESCHWNWQSCQGSHVAFHPFKTLKDYTGCVWRAEHGAKWGVGMLDP